MAGKHSFPPGAASKGGKAAAAKYGGFHFAHAAHAAKAQGLPRGVPAVQGVRPLGGVVTPHAVPRASVGSVLSALRGQARGGAMAGIKVQNATHRSSPVRAAGSRTTGTPRVGGTRRKAG